MPVSIEAFPWNQSMTGQTGIDIFYSLPESFLSGLPDAWDPFSSAVSPA